MRFVSIAFSMLLMTSAVSAQETASADDIARSTFDVMAGGGAWERARYFSYTLTFVKNGKVVASFPQKWDRLTGDYFVSGQRPDGIPYEATINVAKKTIRGSLQGRKLTSPEELKALYPLAEARFINDTLWLLMPLKMFDQGFYRAYDGPRNDSCGHTWDLLKVTVEAEKGKVTATYYPWINRDTHLVDEWDMKLEIMPPDQPPVAVLFHDYRRVGGLLISTRREIQGQNQTVRLDNLQVAWEVPKDAFK